MATLGAGYSFSVNEQVTAAKLATLVNSGTCTSIVNADIDSAAAIANSKLNLASISQAMALSGGLTLSSNGLTMTSTPINGAKGSDVASTTTPNITSTTGNLIHITGTTTITGFATGQAGIIRYLVFDGALTFTHNATSLILPAGANITTAAGDVAVMASEGSGNWRCIVYYKKDGTPVVAGASATQAQMEAGTSAVVPVTPSVAQYHQTNAKAWAVWNGTTTGTNAPLAGYNVATVTRNSAGNYTINLATALSSVNYAPFAFGIDSSGSPGQCIGYSQSAQSASAFSLIIANAGGTVSDIQRVSCIIYGDFA